MEKRMSNNEICRLDAVSLASKIRAKELSPTEVIEAVLARMDQLEPMLHAFCTQTPDLARAEAKRIEQAIADGDEIGPLAGVPVGIKDLVCTKGIKTTSGSFAYEEFVPDEDDVVVERLKAAGAIIIGKTNVPEFGYSGAGHNPVFPTTCNPWNIERTSGGSSAGSGAAVAAGMGPFAIASDGGGSIRIPAAHCGLFGIKASMGRVPLYPGTKDERYPGVSSWESIEHIGPVSRTVADGALMLSVIGSGPDPRDLPIRQFAGPVAQVLPLGVHLVAELLGRHRAHKHLDAGLVLVVAAAIAVVDTQDGFEVCQQMPLRKSFPD